MRVASTREFDSADATDGAYVKKKFGHTEALAEWLWLVDESDGALGLKAQTYEPKTASSAVDAAARLADEIITHRLAYVARERTVRRAVTRLRLADQTLYSVLCAYAGKRRAPKWVLAAWPSIGAVAMITDTYRDLSSQGALTALQRTKGSKSLARLAIGCEGLALLEKAGRALAAHLSAVACDDDSP